MDTRAEAGYAASWTTEGMSGETTVTEQEWMECNRMKPMLAYLRDKVSERKLRFFACGCVRQKWRWLNDILRDSVDVAEGYADGLVTQSALRISHQATWAKAPSSSLHRACWLTELSLGAMLEAAAIVPSRLRCLLLRDIFGNPFRPMTVAPYIQTWNDAVVGRLAQVAYDERQLAEGTLDNSRLAVLADGLEEAGCTSEEILDHLRQPGVHVRGCWAVDLCLGKT
jgi:hypothetical protein